MATDPLTVETLRALLDAAGLPGASVAESPAGGDWLWVDADGLRAVVNADGSGPCPIYDTSAGSNRRSRGRYHPDDLLSALAAKVTARHDAAARVLGAPDLATARGLAAENAALRAEVARLRAVAEAAREFASWAVDIDSPSAAYDLAQLRAALAALEVP